MRPCPEQVGDASLEGSFEMERPELEGCPRHPDLEPVEVVVNSVFSAQADHPQLVITELRCPVCR